MYNCFVKKVVYLDNAATSAVKPEVLKAMLPYFSEKYGNPSEPHEMGREARMAVEISRQTIAGFLGAQPEEIIFTSGATEAINLSHKGVVEAILQGQNSNHKIQTSNQIQNSKFKSVKQNIPHIITTKIEHKAVLDTCKHLEKLGWASVTYLPVDKYGIVSVSDVEKALKPETVLISIMYVNNEVGSIQPIVEIGQKLQKWEMRSGKWEKEVGSGKMEKKRKIYFHTDATQAIQYLDCNVDRLGVDFLSFTGHKIGCPKGIGALYARKESPFVRQMDGGGQEGELRAGTENVPFIVGLGKAVELIYKMTKFK